MPQRESAIEAVSPFPEEELPRVWLWLQEAGSSLLNDLGPQTMDEFVDDWLRRGDNAVSWGVWRDGELGGWVAFEPISSVAGNAHCIFRKAFWGGKTTKPALIQVANDLFANGIDRIVMTVPARNTAIQRLVCWLGGEKEADAYRVYLPDGRLLTQNGEPMALIQYGLLASRWQFYQAVQAVA